MKKHRESQFGDFQTPLALARTACTRIAGFRPRSIVEPTCGQGTFLRAAAEAFPEAKRVLGFDVNRDHLRAAVDLTADLARVQIGHADFFVQDWSNVIRPEQGPWLVIGNPPWVTNSDVGSIVGTNLPTKSNFQGRSGIDSITGKANFDISEWMLLRALDWLGDRSGAVAVLCKTAVARKVLAQAWAAGRPVKSAAMYRIDALAAFGAAVDACLFVLELGMPARERICRVYAAIDDDVPVQLIGFDGRHLIADLDAHRRTRAFAGIDPKYVWRSGVKHDCAKVMELRRIDGHLVNGFDEVVNIEPDLVLPLLKSSDIGNGRTAPRGAMIVPQRFVGEPTAGIRAHFPRTWRYLSDHGALLDRRKSVVYAKHPRFSIFGVGSYSFSSWKVAISGFYKALNFVVVAPVAGRPIVFDDTVYFLPCSSEEEAHFLHRLLTSAPARDFYRAAIHWDEKRPITVGLLKRLSLRALAEALDEQAAYGSFFGSLMFRNAA